MVRELVQYIEDNSSLVIGTSLFALGVTGTSDPDTAVVVEDMDAGRGGSNNPLRREFYLSVVSRAPVASRVTAKTNAETVDGILDQKGGFALPQLSVEGNRLYTVTYVNCEQKPLHVGQDEKGRALYSATYRVWGVEEDSNSAPVLAAIGAQSVATGAELDLTVSATDADGDGITYSVVSLPDNAAINPSSGMFCWDTDASDHGRHTLEFRATDEHGAYDSEDVTVTINTPPVLGSIGAQAVTSGDTLEFTIAATDADGDDVTYSATGLPVGATLDTVTGEFSWTVDDDDIGEHEVTFIATDDYGTTDSETVTITVSGMLRYGLVFDGVDDVAQAPYFDPRSADGTQLSACMWVRWEAIAQYRGLLLYSPARVFLIGTHLSYPGQIRVVLSAAGGIDKEYLSSSVVFDGTWQHIGFSFGSGVLTMYVNGVAVATTKLKDNSITTLNSATSTYTLDRPAGEVAAVVICPRALSAEEMAGCMVGDWPEDAKAIWGWQPQNTGQVLYDQSGNGHDGQLGSTSGVDAQDPSWSSPGMETLPTQGT